MKTPSESVSFRVSAELAKQLDAEAEAAGMSRGEFARKLVVDALEGGEHERLRQDVGEVRAAVNKLREDFATAVAALLTRDRPATVEEAKAWVKSRLLG